MAFSQGAKPFRDSSALFPTKVSFIATIDLANETKEGVYLNGYVVHMGHERAKALQGRKIRVRGRVTLVRAVSNDDSAPVEQGRSVITGHLLRPKIQVLE